MTAMPSSGPRLWVSSTAIICKASSSTHGARERSVSPAPSTRATVSGISSSSTEARNVGLPMVPPGRAPAVPTASPWVRKKS